MVIVARMEETFVLKVVAKFSRISFNESDFGRWAIPALFMRTAY